MITIVVGSQWGDEGKGKWIAALAADLDIIARYQGGNNAGHTLYEGGKKFVLHQLPGGVFQANCVCALLAGMVIDPRELRKEIASVAGAAPDLTPERLWISGRAHVITPWHIERDKRAERGSNALGTTQRGIGPTYCDRATRTGLMMEQFADPDLLEAWIASMSTTDPAFAQHLRDNGEQWDAFRQAGQALRPFVTDAEGRIRAAVAQNKRVVLEGAQGTLLDRDHGTYPFVTSSNTTSGGAVASLGIDPRKVTSIIGIGKVYVTRVGSGPFPTEIGGEIGPLIADRGQEFGATTGRPRKVGWFDAVAMRYSQEVNGYDGLYLNKLDILCGIPELKICVAYDHPTLGRLTEFPGHSSVLDRCTPVYQSFPGWSEEIPRRGDRRDLPVAAQRYLAAIEELAGIRILKIGAGAEGGDIIS